MEFALAGFFKEDLLIEIKPGENSITVSANTAEDTVDPLATGTDPLRETYRALRLHRRRVARRNFSKTYVDYDNNLDLNAASAEFENGLLRLVVPVKQEAKPLEIKIK